MKKLLILTLLSVLSIQSYAAGRVVDAKVIQVRVDLDGRAMAIFDRAVESSPACVNAAFNNTMAFDAATPGGKAVLSLVLSAKANKAKITVYGSGVCGIFGGSNSETWGYGVSN